MRGSRTHSRTHHVEWVSKFINTFETPAFHDCNVNWNIKNALEFTLILLTEGDLFLPKQRKSQLIGDDLALDSENLTYKALITVESWLLHRYQTETASATIIRGVVSVLERSTQRRIINKAHTVFQALFEHPWLHPVANLMIAANYVQIMRKKKDFITNRSLSIKVSYVLREILRNCDSAEIGIKIDVAYILNYLLRSGYELGPNAADESILTTMITSVQSVVYPGLLYQLLGRLKTFNIYETLWIRLQHYTKNLEYRHENELHTAALFVRFIDYGFRHLTQKSKLKLIGKFTNLIETFECYICSNNYSDKDPMLCLLYLVISSSISVRIKYRLTTNLHAWLLAEKETVACKRILNLITNL